ncbi:murein L,D-transpeptidase family protein [Acuticoccus sp. I52.16.1]|uniref:L,D-transpeptidase family protein n=1 Tax=Acuticoccus sp. I52.16.1 TaxID=2928472 RepID=UPI001FD12F86|nr:murein L,D-transpeptidase family protein [Acuticoccus sp. I52.16.1]UOM33638.1 murein L,D-transpeptidase [Acuticoccus sp. I52.16.1]
MSDLGTAKHLAPVPSGLERKMARLNMDKRSPIMLRIYKEDDVLEVWKRDKSGKYKLLENYEICAWSGKLGPKLKEGDRQAPEGFYTVGRGQMNPNSSYYLSFDLGFPNAFDRSLGRTGSHLMVHGDCSSRGCYAMEDQAVGEIYALAREAFMGGQQAFQVQAFPFRMTPENMAKHADSENLAFWENLKEGADHFEVTGVAPKVDVCGKRYVFNASTSGRFTAAAACPDYQVDPSVEQLVAKKRTDDLEKRATIVARAKIRDDREKAWEDREEAIAGFFSRARADSDETKTGAGDAPSTEAAATATATATATGAGGAVPVPRQAPGGQRPANASPAPAAPAPAVASVAGTTTPETESRDAQAPVASTAGAEATAPLGYAAEDDDAGFFSSVAKSSRGLFRSAGKLFN